MYLLEGTCITKCEINVSHKDGPWIEGLLVTLSGLHI